jgi:ParB family chromosome partitioning protein
MLGRTGPLASSAALNPTAPRVDIDRLEPNPKQYRTRIDQAKVEELAASIKQHGQIEAITYRKTAEGKLQIIGGERRWRAIQLLRERAENNEERARFSTILANERVVSGDAEMLDLAVTENLQRIDPDEVDTAAALADVQTQRRLSTPELAAHFGIKADRAKRLLRLHSCPAFVKDAVSGGLMVPVTDDDGKPIVGEGGRERREHRSLDLMAALEFGSLYLHLERARTAAAAAKKTETLVRQALEEGWPFRVIQERCRREKERLSAKADGAPADGEAHDGGGEGTGEGPRIGKVPPPPYRDDERQLVIFRGRLASATHEQRAELRSTLESLLRTLTA